MTGKSDEDLLSQVALDVKHYATSAVGRYREFKTGLNKLALILPVAVGVSWLILQSGEGLQFLFATYPVSSVTALVVVAFFSLIPAMRASRKRHLEYEAMLKSEAENEKASRVT